MINDLAALRLRLSGVKPWMAVAFIAAVVLLMYYGMLGMRYWQAVQEAPTLRSQISLLQRSTNADPFTEEERLEAVLASETAYLEDLESLFDYSQTDDLLAIVSETAQETPINLLGMSVGDPQIEYVENIQYQTLPMTLTLQGETQNIYRFVALMHHKVPVISVGRIGIANIDKTPSTQIFLQAILSPEPFEGEVKK